MDDKLIAKHFYTTLLKEDSNAHPVEQLGEQYFAEQKKEVYDLSYIRFAQGEIYFHHKDYETAIFKWENINNELAPWAKKNMADAYFQLGLLNQAEQLYLSIETDSDMLNTEIQVCLYHLYVKQENDQKADEMIKTAVFLNPDYPNVTKIARTFYESRSDWKSAVELAVSECSRTKSPEWQDALIEYVKKGYINDFSCDYFINPLITAYHVNHDKFHELLHSLWETYLHSDMLLEWIKTAKQIFALLKIEKINGQTEEFFKETLNILFSGQFAVKEIEPIVPDFLKYWLDAASEKTLSFACSGVLSWNDYFPFQMEKETIEKAKQLLSTNDPIKLNDSLQLLTDIYKWAESQQLELESFPDELSFHITGDSNVRFQEHDEEKQQQILNYIRRQLNGLVDKRAERETYLEKNKAWYEDMLAKLKGAVHQIKDAEQEKGKIIQENFQEKLSSLSKEIEKDVADAIKSCKDFINEGRDLGNIQFHLNKEMNKRVERLISEKIEPSVSRVFNKWLTEAEIELENGSAFVEEMKESFNRLFKEERLHFQCSFQVLNDWKRDIERMTNFVHVDKFNIVDRFTPGQLLLKYTGKVIAPFTKKRNIIIAQYRKWLENEDFSHIATEIANELLHPYKLIERSLQKDVQTFFKEPIDCLKKTADELEEGISRFAQELEELKMHPEKFKDPIVLFELRLRMLEWLTDEKQASVQRETY